MKQLRYLCPLANNKTEFTFSFHGPLCVDISAQRFKCKQNQQIDDKVLVSRRGTSKGLA